MRIELTTSSLPRKCSTPELQRPDKKKRFHLLNRIHSNSKSHEPIFFISVISGKERETRLELATYSLEGYRSTK